MDARMRLIVGLGNPGPEYAWTPHNLGFLALDRLAELAGARVERPEAKSLVGRGRLAGHEVLLAKPQTFMNVSGLAVRDLLARCESEPTELIVLYDDVALPWGMIRVRGRGTAGGHNGMKSIIGALGSMDFPRVRLGVQPEHPVDDLADYVLRPMRRALLESAAEMVDAAAEAVQAILMDGVGRAMTRFNRRVQPPESL
ncbi:MAG: aminoacyl-tRNA hydrolase [Acidobacteria bacterium]|nr:aminoacyl-tRNA hydrolase [Acidobacteriota bacterium]MCL5287068.1 aminoacyl-tRNA hydrolase [Acidobacteriota bacterium]